MRRGHQCNRWGRGQEQHGKQMLPAPTKSACRTMQGRAPSSTYPTCGCNPVPKLLAALASTSRPAVTTLKLWSCKSCCRNATNCGSCCSSTCVCAGPRLARPCCTCSIACDRVCRKSHTRIQRGAVSAGSGFACSSRLGLPCSWHLYMIVIVAIMQ